MAAVPVGGALKRATGTTDVDFAKVFADELHRHWQAFGRERGRHRQRGMTGQAERRGVTDQRGQFGGHLPERGHRATVGAANGCAGSSITSTDSSAWCTRPVKSRRRSRMRW